MKRPVLLDLLVENKELTVEQAERSLAIQRDSNTLIGLILLEEGYISDETLCRYLAMEYESALDPRCAE